MPAVVERVLLQLLEAGRVVLDVLAVVEALAHDHVHPREQESEVGAGFDGQVELRFAGGDGKKSPVATKWPP